MALVASITSLWQQGRFCLISDLKHKTGSRIRKPEVVFKLQKWNKMTYDMPNYCRMCNIKSLCMHDSGRWSSKPALLLTVVSLTCNSGTSNKLPPSWLLPGQARWSFHHQHAPRWHGSHLAMLLIAVGVRGTSSGPSRACLCWGVLNWCPTPATPAPLTNSITGNSNIWHVLCISTQTVKVTLLWNGVNPCTWVEL